MQYVKRYMPMFFARHKATAIQDSINN